MQAIRLAALMFLALPLRAEIYRCEQDNGGKRFVSDPGACEHAVEHTPRGTIQPLDPSRPEDARDSQPTPGAAQAGGTRELIDVFAGAPGPSWEVLDEPPESAIADPGLRALGLRASQARHYTRARGPVSEVCTVELWAFEYAAEAASARAAFQPEGWYVTSAGPLLVLAHGVRLERDVGSRRGLVEGCTELAEATRRRAASR